VSWLPAAPSPPKEDRRPWLAPALSGKGLDVTTLTYIVVDEIVGGIVGLSLSPWPAADSRGRLRFDVEDDPTHVAVHDEILCEFLNDHGLPFVPPEGAGDPDSRPLLIGTTLAAQVRLTSATLWRKPLSRWIPGSIYDISANARELAKLAYYASVAELWEQKRAEDLGLTESS